MTQTKLFHKDFLRVAEKVKANSSLTRRDDRVIVNEAKWVRTYLEQKRTASAARVNPGRKQSADSEVKAASLKKREYRERKAAEDAGNSGQ